MIPCRLVSATPFLGLLLLVSASPGVAQPDTVPGSVNVARLGRLCWWEVHPAPGCRAWVATEIAWEQPIAFTKSPDQSVREDTFDGRLVMSVGPMFNYQPKAALGVLAAFAADESNGPFLLRSEGRYRRWIGRRTGVDIGAGFAQAWVPASAAADRVKARGITGSIGIEHRVIGVDARVDWLNGGGEPFQAGLVGVRTSASGSAFVYGASILVYIGLVTAFLIDSGN